MATAGGDVRSRETGRVYRTVNEMEAQVIKELPRGKRIWSCLLNRSAA